MGCNLRYIQSIYHQTHSLQAKKVGILVVKKLSQNKWIQTNFYSINYRKLSKLLKSSTVSENVEPEAEDQNQGESTASTLSKIMKKG